MSFDDTGWVRQAQQGEEAAFIAIYNQYHPAIYTYIYYRVQHQMLAEDLTAEVFVRLVSKVHTFTPGKRPLLAWLYTIAGNLVRDHYRRHKRLQFMPLNERDADDSIDMNAYVDHRLRQTQLREAMTELTEEQRQVVLLRFVEGQTTPEAAAHLGKPISAVKALQHRAIAALRRHLLPEGATQHRERKGIGDQGSADP